MSDYSGINLRAVLEIKLLTFIDAMLIIFSITIINSIDTYLGLHSTLIEDCYLATAIVAIAIFIDASVSLGYLLLNAFMPRLNYTKFMLYKFGLTLLLMVILLLFDLVGDSVLGVFICLIFSISAVIYYGEIMINKSKLPDELESDKYFTDYKDIIN